MNAVYIKQSVYLLLAVLFSNSTTCFGQLDDSKNELNQKRKKRDSESTYTPKKEKNIAQAFAGETIGNIVAGAIIGGIYIGLIGNYSNENQLHNPLSVYPYRDALNGNYTTPRSKNIHKNIRFDIEDKFLYSNQDLYGNHFKIKLRPFQYCYFQSEMFHLFEYNNTLDQHFNLFLYNLDFCYDRIRFERFNLGFTAGANYVANEVKKGGFAFGFNTEIFVVKPISIFSSIKWSGINGQPVNTFEVQGKYHHKNLFASLGYMHLKIAHPTYDFVSVGLGIYL